jgi:DNA-binding beta-propeller fold protein YncE
MATTTEPREEEQQEAPEPQGGDRSTRRMLVALAVILALGAVALLGLLLWLLRPEDTAGPEEVAGYPIEVVTNIYGYGDAANEQLRQPLGAAFDAEGNVWIANTGRSRVEEYTSGGDYIRSVGEDPNTGTLYSPYGVAVDTERNIVYVADMGAEAVQLYTTDGNWISTFPAADQNPKVFGADGFTPYHVELLNGRVVVSTADGLYFFDQEGHVVARWGGTFEGEHLRGSGDGVFNFPDSFATDPATGWIYVADTMNRRVIAIDQDGFWKWVSGTPDKGGKITSFWQLPRSITFGPDGNLYVIDTFRFDQTGMGTGHVVVLSRDGQLLSEFGRAGTGDGDFNYPDQLSSGPDGLWAVADRENNRVVVFRLLTPYPAVDDLLARRYDPGFSEPDHVWVTPPPTPPIDTGDGNGG